MIVKSGEDMFEVPHYGQMGSVGYVSGETEPDIISELYAVVEEITGKPVEKRRIRFM